MGTTDLLQRIINAYSKKKNNWIISFDELCAFVDNLVLNDESGRYDVFSINTVDVVTARLIAMEEGGLCGIRYKGTRPEAVLNTSYLGYAVKTAFEKMDSNSEQPFPTESELGFSIPEDRVTTLIMPDQLSMVFENESKKGVYRLTFKGDVPPVLATADNIRGRLLVLAVNKIRNFLAHKNNSNYIYQKMLPICRNNTRGLIDIIKMVQSNPGRAATAIRKPDELVFTFWTQLCAYIKKDKIEKEARSSQDEGLLHAAVIINSHILYFKNLILKKKQKAAALKLAGEEFRKEPFYFTISDIYEFSDKNGPLLDKRYDRDDLHGYIKDKTKLKEKEVLSQAQHQALIQEIRRRSQSAGGCGLSGRSFMRVLSKDGDSISP